MYDTLSYYRLGGVVKAKMPELSDLPKKKTVFPADRAFSALEAMRRRFSWSAGQIAVKLYSKRVYRADTGIDDSPAATV